jgi:hypothetical protein
LKGTPQDRFTVSFEGSAQERVDYAGLSMPQLASSRKTKDEEEIANSQCRPASDLAAVTGALGG